MRTVTVALLLSLMAPAAFAQDIDVTDPATQPKPIAAVPDVKDTKLAPGEKPADTTGEPNLKVAKDSGGKSTSSLILDAPLKNDFVEGKSTAPITIVEYASMSCPHCAHFSNTTLPDLEKKYIDTGKVKYILRQFPLNEPALKGAELLYCVGAQDPKKYYVFARVLFDAQSKWAFDGNYLAGLQTIAEVGGLTKEQFNSCINNTDREMKVLKDKQAANDELKVPHTPYIFIDGEVYEGNRDIETVSAFIDGKLAKKK